MPNRNCRIILDTNLWISFLITKNYDNLDDILFSGKAVLIFSSELLNEFISVAKRPKFKQFFSNADIEALISTIDEYAEFVSVHSKVKACRDAKDNFLLALSTDGNADFFTNGR